MTTGYIGSEMRKSGDNSEVNSRIFSFVPLLCFFVLYSNHQRLFYLNTMETGKSQIRENDTDITVAGNA